MKQKVKVHVYDARVRACLFLCYVGLCSSGFTAKDKEAFEVKTSLSIDYMVGSCLRTKPCTKQNKEI